MRSSPAGRPKRPPRAPPPLSPPPPPSPPAPQPRSVPARANVGRTLATAFNAAGRPALLTPARKGLPSLIRSLESLPNAVVFLAVPDDALLAVAERLSEAGGRISGTVAFVHLSGAQELNALAPLRANHPLGSLLPPSPLLR